MWVYNTLFNHNNDIDIILVHNKYALLIVHITIWQNTKKHIMLKMLLLPLWMCVCHFRCVSIEQRVVEFIYSMYATWLRIVTITSRTVSWTPICFLSSICTMEIFIVCARVINSLSIFNCDWTMLRDKADRLFLCLTIAQKGVHPMIDIYILARVIDSASRRFYSTT